jgi:aspartate kinase
MVGSYGFLSRVFAEFERHKLSVDVLASSEVSVSLTMDKKQDSQQISKLFNSLQDCTDITRKDNKSILTLIADVEKSSEVLAIVFRVFSTQNIQVEMMSQGASKVNISFVINSVDLDRAVAHLHECFFENECVIQNIQLNTEEIDFSIEKNGEENIDELLSAIQKGIDASDNVGVNRSIKETSI